MENKNTVTDAKIENLNELTKVLSVKEQAQEKLLVVIKTCGIGKIVRNLKFDKVQGYTLSSLFITLVTLVGENDSQCHFRSFSGTLHCIKEHVVSHAFERSHRLADVPYQNHPLLP